MLRNPCAANSRASSKHRPEEYPVREAAGRVDQEHIREDLVGERIEEDADISGAL